MSDPHQTLESMFSDIADAIRAKTGGSSDLLADDFPEAIAAIPNEAEIPVHEPRLTLSALFSDIADAIREKTGNTSAIIADDFPDAIAAIPAEEGKKGYILFEGDEAFSLYVRNKSASDPTPWDGVLEYSIDAVNWTAWDGSSIASGQDNVIYLRGYNNTVISGYTRLTSGTGFYISPSSVQISCSGNINNLLDYRIVLEGGQPAIGEYAFYKLFYGCTSLTTAPVLSATTLASYCYSQMFYGCTSLTTIPTLPALVLETYCYNNMFYGCRSIRISTTQDETYAYKYRIPSSGIGTTATGAMTRMFNNTGGSFTGTPIINTTYYIDTLP